MTRILQQTLVVLLATAGVARAQSTYTSLQIPKQIQYQGRVSQNGVPWNPPPANNGKGYFVFALIDELGTVLWNNYDGSWTPGNPSAVPPVPDSFPSDPATTLLSNNFTEVPVTGGAFSIQLGGGPAAKNLRIDPVVFYNPKTNMVRSNVKLAVWFSADSQTFTRLSPDVSLTSVPYAMVAGIAESVRDRAVTGAKVAENTVPLSALVARGRSATAGVGGLAMSGDPGNGTTESHADIPVSNMTVTLTTRGGPVMIACVPHPLAATSNIACLSPAGSSLARGFFTLFRDGVPIGVSQIGVNPGQASTLAIHYQAPVLSLQSIDIPPTPGPHTYQLFMRADRTFSNSTVDISGAALGAFEF